MDDNTNNTGTPDINSEDVTGIVSSKSFVEDSEHKLSDLLSGSDNTSSASMSDSGQVETWDLSDPDQRLLLRQRCAEDIDVLTQLIFGDVFDEVDPWPPFYKQAYHEIIHACQTGGQGDTTRLGIGLPRALCKTSFLKVVACAVFLFDLRKFILKIGSSDVRAYDATADIHFALTSANVIAVFPEWANACVRDTAEVKVYVINGKTKHIVAAGKGTSIRGINKKHMRPDWIDLDDAQTKEESLSPTEIEKFENWFTGTLQYTKAHAHTLITYTGNMYNEACFLNKIKSNPMWKTLITGAVLKGYRALWPARKPIEALINDYKHDAAMGKADIWFAEIQNDIRPDSNKLLGNKPMHFVSMEDMPDAAFITIDPAGMKKQSDANAIIAHGIYDDIPHVIDGNCELKAPLDIIKKAIEFCITYNGSIIGVEAVAYQATLAYWFKLLYQGTLDEYGIEIVELRPGARSKEMRIRSWVSSHLKGFYPITSMPMYFYLEWEAQNYVIGAQSNTDDGLDSCAYGLDILGQHKDKLRYYIQQTTAPVKTIPSRTCLDGRHRRSPRLTQTPPSLLHDSRYQATPYRQ